MACHVTYRTRQQHKHAGAQAARAIEHLARGITAGSTKSTHPLYLDIGQRRKYLVVARVAAWCLQLLPEGSFVLGGRALRKSVIDHREPLTRVLLEPDLYCQVGV